MAGHYTSDSPRLGVSYVFRRFSTEPSSLFPSCSSAKKSGEPIRKKVEWGSALLEKCI